VATREANIVPSESDSPSVKMRLLAWFSRVLAGGVGRIGRACPPSSLRAKRSNPCLNPGWIASSLTLLAMTN
jgi:hypothetical protein